MIEKAEALTIENVTVSSTVIREALLDGRLDLANRLLGYDYFLSGKVISGRKIGRSIGYPTANINPDPDKLIPSDGVYAVVVILQGKEHMGMLSIGTNPTVSSGARVRSIEVNLIDFQGDIYGERLKIVFCKRLRNEMKFESIDKLTHQMSADREDTLNFFRKDK